MERSRTPTKSPARSSDPRRGHGRREETPLRAAAPRVHSERRPTNGPLRRMIPITVVVNGQPTVVDTPKDVPFGAIILEALHQTENTGQPPAEPRIQQRSSVRDRRP